MLRLSGGVSGMSIQFSPEQFELLQGMGCDFGQGYLFSPAVSATEFAKMVTDNVFLVTPLSVVSG